MNLLMNTPVSFLFGYALATSLILLLAISFLKISLLEFKIWHIEKSNLTKDEKASKLRIVDFQKMNLCFSFDLDKNFNFKDPIVKEEYKNYSVQEIKTGLSFVKTITC